ncbi:hypothetical protein [Arenimonas terrae]|jgi:hypothetical protein|uniref:Uncharacterized protein n=1 Tax=Arenimonas terrae TaxID=2546226 RepID=A0A5C4RTT7_9GAMM|nr:hypothetical protein [Arenimonas terrae]TNJ34448.1 hypothetical protein E1B00_01280 [Arenimonas terrae]
MTARRPAPRTSAAFDAGIEPMLHTACVKAGAGAALQVGIDRLPLLKPFLPARVRRAGSSESAEDIQRHLVESIYRRYQLKPAGWEVEGVLAVAQTQAVLSPLATREGLRGLLRGWLPSAVSTPLMRYTPLEPLVTATVRAVAATWAAGRYADSVCRLRKAGADWLPAPLAGALRLAPSTLKAWSAEALALAMPPLKLATALGRQLAGGSVLAPPKKKAVAKKTPARKATPRGRRPN